MVTVRRQRCSSGRQLVITLTDGGAGDADGVANGVIVDPGAPAVVAPQALRFSTAVDRSDPLRSRGATVSGKVAVFVPGTDQEIRWVRFSVDGRTFSEDADAPVRPRRHDPERPGRAAPLPTARRRHPHHLGSDRPEQRPGDNAGGNVHHIEPPACRSTADGEHHRDPFGSGSAPTAPSWARPRSSSREEDDLLAVVFYVDDPSASRLPTPSTSWRRSTSAARS